MTCVLTSEKLSSKSSEMREAGCSATNTGGAAFGAGGDREGDAMESTVAVGEDGAASCGECEAMANWRGGGDSC